MLPTLYVVWHALNFVCAKHLLMKTEQTPEERYREREELKKTLIRKVRQLSFILL